MDEVTAVEAAALTGLSERTIRRRIAAGTLQARRIAANRFAIRLDDLPQRKGLDALVARIEAIERRVRPLESQRAAEPGNAVQTAPDEAALGVPAAQLRDLVDQLAHEVNRIAPLLTAGAHEATGDAAARPTPQRGRRGKLRAMPDARSASDG
jgi:hypothetical protein